MRKTLTVVVEASTQETLDDMVESLARVACDVANSTEDTDEDDESGAHIWIEDAPFAVVQLSVAGIREELEYLSDKYNVDVPARNDLEILDAIREASDEAWQQDTRDAERLHDQVQHNAAMKLLPKAD